jgi:hypothetical protein
MVWRPVAYTQLGALGRSACRIFGVAVARSDDFATDRCMRAFFPAHLSGYCDAGWPDARVLQAERAFLNMVIGRLMSGARQAENLVGTSVEWRNLWGWAGSSDGSYVL